MTPILMLGAGRMGGAMIEGWREASAFPLSDLMTRTISPKPQLAAWGVRTQPSDADLTSAKTVILAVKPQVWESVAREVDPLLAPDAVIVSVIAGVPAARISAAMGGRPTARVMPTTAVAITQGAATLYAADPDARAVAQALFDPIATTVDLDDEDLMHAATAVSGSAPAYLYAFVEALEAGGVGLGLTTEQSAKLARATMAGSAALMARSGEEPATLRRQVTSPNGVTLEATNVLTGGGGFPDLLPRAMAAAVRRSRELAGA